MNLDMDSEQPASGLNRLISPVNRLVRDLAGLDRVKVELRTGEFGTATSQSVGVFAWTSSSSSATTRPSSSASGEPSSEYLSANDR